jgi:hypothetical protein
MPSTVWIWDLSSLRLIAVLHHLLPVRSAVCLTLSLCVDCNKSWHPFREVLLVTTSSSRFYLWSLKGAFCVDVPYHGLLFIIALWLDQQDFVVSAAKWHPEGSHILLSDKARVHHWSDDSPRRDRWASATRHRFHSCMICLD